jgi:WXG100 family type VII secretion target
LTGFVAESGRIGDAAKHVIDVRDQVMGDINRLQGEIEQLGSQWQGNAAMAFGTLMTRWNEDERKLRDALTGIAEQLAASGTQYQTTEDEQSESMNRIMNALGGS